MRLVHPRSMFLPAVILWLALCALAVLCALAALGAFVSAIWTVGRAFYGR